MNIRSLPPWKQRDARIGEYRTRADDLTQMARHLEDHEEFREAASYHREIGSIGKSIDHLLAIDWKEIGAHTEPKTAEDKRALADTLEAWAKSLRDDADKETT
jgi:hypothetical protein